MVRKTNILQFKSSDVPFLAESLRMSPPFSMLIRQCTKDFELNHPDHEKPIHIPKGTPMMIHIAAIHRDPKNFDNPMEFDPDRFLEKNAKQYFLEGKLMTFGGGPRTCLGES